MKEGAAEGAASACEYSLGLLVSQTGIQVSFAIVQVLASF